MADTENVHIQGALCNGADTMEEPMIVFNAVEEFLKELEADKE